VGKGDDIIEQAGPAAAERLNARENDCFPA
jgi:hypothetical protein